VVDDDISGTVDSNANQPAQRLRQVLERVLHEGNVLALREHAINTIEIGLAYGVSALFICEGHLMNELNNARHVVVDPHQTTGFKNCGLQLLEEAGASHLIEFHAEESQILSFRDFVDF